MHRLGGVMEKLVSSEPTPVQKGKTRTLKIKILSLREKEILEPTGIDWVRKNIGNSFSNMFLTLLSIIQGLALAVLASAVEESTLNVLNSIMFLTTFLMIVGIWHAYYWLAAIAKWTPLIYDSLLMFCIGAAELAAIYSMPGHEWFYFLGLLTILGGVQYKYNARRLGDGMWAPNAKALGKHIREYKSKRVPILLFAGFILFVLGLASKKWTGWMWAFCLVPLIVQVFLVLRHLTDQQDTVDKIAGN